MKKKCGHINDCGCKDKYLTTPAPCPPGEPCEDAQPCSSYTNAQCVIYTGEDIICDEQVVIENGALLNDILAELVLRICENSEIQSCNLIATISLLEQQEDSVILEVNTLNGSGNYNYDWSFADNTNALEYVSFTNNQATIQQSLDEFLFPFGLAQVIVTDEETECQTTATFLVALIIQV
jgi:hypothetical protein